MGLSLLMAHMAMEESCDSRLQLQDGFVIAGIFDLERDTGWHPA
jgi:hypothetical protein